MEQAELNRAVARATGETVSRIKRLGFLLMELPAATEESSELEFDVIDWDELQAQRLADGRHPREPSLP